MKSTGVEFVSEEPYVLRDYRWKDETYSAVHIVFSRPSTTHGVLIELQQWFR
jgi:hypothetical protein